MNTFISGGSLIKFNPSEIDRLRFNRFGFGGALRARAGDTLDSSLGDRKRLSGYLRELRFASRLAVSVGRFAFGRPLAAARI